MGKPVTIDSDDLEMLLAAVALPVQIEQLFQAREEDVQFNWKKGRHEQAFDRCRRAWGAAIRVIDDPIYNEPLSNEESAILFGLLNEGKSSPFGHVAPTVKNTQTLIRKGMLVAGTVHSLIKWGDKTDEINPSGIMVWKVTHRGVVTLQEGPRATIVD